ncbi:minor capsid protein [Jeotgalibaca porci]|uniref:minor capsid protein n=1 Tax=Jeotgalibaca porci TaxID=1868793 RepID=UPI0035A13924
MTKKETASEKYWNRRRELEDKALLNAENETIRELTTEVFPGALKKIQEKLLSQSNLHNMTQSELLENFSNRDQKKYRDYVNNNYQELMSSDKKYQEFIDEYFPPYDYAKINRLTQMRADIFSIMASEMIKSDVNQKFNTRLEDVVNKMYGSNSKALFQLLGTGEVHALPKKELEDMLNYPWSGKTFSNRLWGNVSRLEQNLSLSIVNAATSGDGVLSVLKDMKGNDEISSMFKQEEGKFNRAIENLVRTEYAHFAVEGVKKSLDDAGIKDKQSWSAEDERVCSICGGRHGKIITDDWYPPYHGRCRCSLIPKMPELSEDIDEIYEEMFGSLLDEFAKDNFGINLTHPESKKTKTTTEEKVKKAFENLRSNETIKNNLQKEINLEKEIEELSKTPKNIDYKKEHRRLREALEEQYDDGEIDDDEYNASLAELRERFKRSNLTGDMKDNSDKMISLKNQLLELQESNAIKNADIIKSELAKYREMGAPSDVDMKEHLTKPNSRASKMIAKAYDYYPTDWVRKSAEHGIIDVGTAKRGYYSAGFKELRLSGARGKRNSFRTALHELGHRMEDVDKAILERERQFYEYRTKGETLQSLKKLKGGNYKENEMTRVDNFLNPYMGKDYGGSSYEILTMGIDTLYTRPTELMKDPEMFEWVVGMLLK